MPRLLLALLALMAAPVLGGDFAQWTPWQAAPGSDAAVRATAKGIDARSTAQMQRHPDGEWALRWSHKLQDPPGVVYLEAEDAVLTHATTYPDKLASALSAVGAYGDQPGATIDFGHVTSPSGIRLIYNSGRDQTTWATLFVGDEPLRRLHFPTTNDWRSEFLPVEVAQPVDGRVRLVVTEQDWEENGRTFACNIDRLESIAGAEPLAARLLLPLGEREPHAVSVLLSAPGARFRIGVAGPDGQESLSIPLNVKDQQPWARFTLLLHDLRPLPTPGDGDRRVFLEVTSRASAGEGEIWIRDVVAANAWPSTPPADNPFELSTDLRGLRFTGRIPSYTQADTWYPTWAADGNLYSSYTDGTVGTLFSRSDNYDATTGAAVIRGDDPMALEVQEIGIHRSSPWPFATRYPCGSLVHDGVWYFGTYIINGDARPNGFDSYQGPFVGFRTSTDFGESWTETPRTPQDNLFNERVDWNGAEWTRVKMGSPHVVDFGQELEHSPDGKAYIVAHGNSRNDTPQSWILGDEVFLARCEPSVETINDPAAWEFFAGFDAAGAPRWAGDFAAIQPIAAWEGRMGCVTLTHEPSLRKYLLVVGTGKAPADSFDTIILESDRIEGPYKLVSYMEKFGRQAYFTNIPSKFLREDGLGAWLCYSANWTGHDQSPLGSTYAMTLAEFEWMR